MSSLVNVVNVLLLLGVLVPAGMVAYLLLLTLAAWIARGKTVVSATPRIASSS